MLLVAGVAIAAIGVFITFRPFASLSALIVLISVGLIVTGIASITTGDRVWRWAVGAAWIVAGLGILVWPDLSTRGLALVAGISLVAGGVVDIAGGLRATRDERFAAVVGGVASVVFGVLALAWPDVTVLVVAVVFGARTVLVGVHLAWGAIRGRVRDHDASPPPGRLRRTSHALVAVLSLLLASGLAVVSAKLHAGEPVVDAFYDAPDDVPDRPGVLLRSEPYSRDVPTGAVAWRILYTTTRDDAEPALASGIVVVPAAAGGEPFPVVAWAHGTTGIDRTCAPSILDTGLGAGAFYSLDDVIAQGWSLVATDYIGLGTEGPHPYLIGQGEARSVLDAVRAARQLPDVSLSGKTVVWGHSQGGHAALWTGQLSPSYAPDVPLSGVAALAPASDLAGLVDTLGNIPGGSVFATYVVSAYASAYDDVRVGESVRPIARTVFDETAERCLGEPSVFVSILTSVTTSMSIFSTTDLDDGPLGERLHENIPTRPIPAPLLIAQGGADSLVVPDVQQRYVDGLCAAGQALDYRTYPGLDHVPLVEVGSPLIPELLDWTADRFVDAPFVPTCTPSS